MPADQIIGLAAAFEALDTDQSGSLSLNEIRAGFERMDPKVFQRDDCQRVFKSVDFDNSHEIRYNEFVAACLGKKRYTQRDVLWRAFCAMDVNARGYITYEDLREVLNADVIRDTFGHHHLKKSFQQIDVDHNGKIDFAEFRWMMETGGRQRSRDSMDDL